MMEGSVITAVKAIGTTQGDERAYVQVQIQNGQIHALAFGPEMAASVCSAFLSAAGHLEKKQAMRRKPGDVPVGVPIQISECNVSIGKSPILPNAIVLTLSTQSGAALHFELPAHLTQKIISGLSAAAAQIESPGPTAH
jgi:hypothetical protein